MTSSPKLWRTYLIRVKVPSGTFWYAGQHKIKSRDMSKDMYYLGSGKVLGRFREKYGDSCLHIKWLSFFESQESVNNHEIYLIAKLREKHGKSCINILRGGHYTKPSFDTLSKAQKKCQNTPERKEVQRKAMNEFYKRGGSQIISAALRKKFRTGIWWHDPCNSEMRQYIIDGNGLTATARLLISKYPEITPAKIKNAYYEIKNSL